MAPDIEVKNPTLGTIGLDLVRFGRGSWSYQITRIDGEIVHDVCHAEPMAKKEAEKRAKNFGRTCRWDRKWGYVI